MSGKSPEEEIGARRAKFSQQIAGFVREGRFIHALELIKYAEREELVKQGVENKREIKETNPVWDEIAFLAELKGSIVGMMRKKREEEGLTR